MAMIATEHHNREHGITAACKRATNVLDLLAIGEKQHIGMCETGSNVSVGPNEPISSVRELHEHVAAFAARNELTRVTVYFSPSVLADRTHRLDFNVSQVFTVKSQEMF